MEILLKHYGVLATTPLSQQSSNLSLNSELGGLSTIATMMPLIFLSVASLVLNVLMTRIADKQRTIVGTLKALGYGNRAIFMHFTKLGLAVAVFGSVLGCAMGSLISQGLLYFYKNFFSFPRLTAHIYPMLFLVAIAISMFFSLPGNPK